MRAKDAAIVIGCTRNYVNRLVREKKIKGKAIKDDCNQLHYRYELDPESVFKFAQQKQKTGRPRTAK